MAEARISEANGRAWTGGGGEGFRTTHWSVVLSAGDGSTTVARQAMEELCRVYWFPLYAFVRRLGNSPEDSQDLTQEFFARCLERGSFATADREKGRFRTFLATSVRRFVTEEWRRANRQKRGGGHVFVPLAPAEAERRYAASEPRDELSPDLLYDRRWAEALLARVLERLSADYESTGRSAVYRRLQHLLWGRSAELSYEEIGRELGINEGAVKVAVHRLRQRFRDLLREEVSHTVGSPDEVDAELRHLLGVFGGRA